MNVPENPFRAGLAEMYMKKIMVDNKFNEAIRKAVNGEDGESRSLDYYIASEIMINNTIQVFMTIKKEHLNGAGVAFSNMLGYVSYEILALTANENSE